MENFENENLELEQEPPKLSAKQYVRQRLAFLADGTIELRKRKVGRPRLHPDGYKYDRKDPNVDPKISALRAEAGRKGAAVVQGRKMLDTERRKYGRIFQERLDKDLDQVKTEITNFNDKQQYTRTFEKEHATQDAMELVWNCRILLEGMAWDRSYFPAPPFESFMDEFDALAAETPAGRNVFIKPEQWHSFGARPEICADDIIGLAKHRVNLAELPLLKRMAIRALQAFLEFAAKQKDERVLAEIASTVPKVEQAIPKVVDGSIYNPPPPPEPPEPIKSIEEQWREYHERYATYPKGESQPLEPFEQKEDRLQRQAEEEMLHQKQLEHQRQMDLDRLRHFQSLPPEALNVLYPDVFGAVPRRK